MADTPMEIVEPNPQPEVPTPLTEGLHFDNAPAPTTRAEAQLVHRHSLGVVT